jgi:hypothetical protein
MKLRSTAILAALAAMAFFVAVAAPTNKKTIYLTEPMIVGSVTLQPGEYTMEWNGPDPDVQVSFSRGNKTIVTVPAALEAAQNRQDISVTCRTEESGAHSLIEIGTKNATLHFTRHEVSGRE